MSFAAPAQREVSVHLLWRATDLADYLLAVRPAARGTGIVDTLSVTMDGVEIIPGVLRDAHATHLDRFLAGPSDGGSAEFLLDYRARVGRVPAPSLETLDAIRYLRPSRYCESDVLTPDARARFGHLRGTAEKAQAVSAWVFERFIYLPGAGSGDEGAVQTLQREGAVCRDYAHVLIAYLRALDVPARAVSVYAPGLAPMDFHAVAEVLIDGRWCVFDATRLAPRRAMVRIATGRDGADTAFLTNVLSDIELLEIAVDARMADGDDLPPEDPDELVELG